MKVMVFNIFKKNIFKKAKAIVKIELQRQMMYRADFVFFRLTNIIEIVIMIIVWSVIYSNNDVVGGYTYKEMMTYVAIGWLMIFITTNYGLESGISRNIQDGTMTNYLLRPIDYIKYLLVYSVGRSSIAFSSGILTSLAIILLMYDKIIILSSLVDFVIILIMLFLGYFLNVLVSIIIGLLAFWLNFINGPRYSIRVVVNFLIGRNMPLNILPLVFFKITLLFPFAYIYFMPLQLYLGKISTKQGLMALGVELVWLIVLYGLVRLMWNRGLKKYEGVGI